MTRSTLETRGMLIGAGAGNVPTPTPPMHSKPLQPNAVGSNPFSQEVGSFTKRSFDADRFVLAGGNLNSKLLHPTAVPFEQLYRRLPEEGMYAQDVSPSNPFTFELGAFTVPDKMELLIFDLRPDIYRFSGVDSGDFLPIEARRYSSIMGFDLTVDQRRQGNVKFELDPVAIQRTSQEAFKDNNLQHPTFNQGQFEIGKANQFASSSGAATALLPQRPDRFGALSVPFTLYAKSKQTVQVRCVIFRPIPSPLAFIEYDLAGILVPQEWTNTMLKAVKPPMAEGSEEIR